MAEITSSPFDNILFRLDKSEGGFQNDVTPLDEYNMNLILKAILENKENMESNDDNLRKLLDNEEAARIDADTQLRDDFTNRDKAINMAAFGNDTTPTTGDSLQAQIAANNQRLDELDTTNATDKQLADAVKAEKNARTKADSDNLTEAKDYVDEQNIFETDIVTVEKFGGIDAGTDLNGMTIHEVLNKLLYPYVDASVGNATGSPNGGTYEKGVTKTITSVSISVTKKSEPITSVALYNGSTLIEEKTGDAVKNGGTITFTNLNVVVPTNGNQLTVKVTYPDANGNAKTVEKKTTALTFVYPYYMGECAADATIDEVLIKGLTKKVESRGSKTVTHSCENGGMVIAYPKAHGVLNSILDPNNFETIGDYTRSEVSITGLDGTAQTYYVYASGAATVSGFKVQYKY